MTLAAPAALSCGLDMIPGTLPHEPGDCISVLSKRLERTQRWRLHVVRTLRGAYPLASAPRTTEGGNLTMMMNEKRMKVAAKKVVKADAATKAARAEFAEALVGSLKLGETLKRLAARLGVSTTYVWDVSRGRRNVTVEMAKRTMEGDRD